jgi:hypothetical protein
MKNQMYAKVSKEMINTEDFGIPTDYFIAYISACHFGIIQHCLREG